MPIFYIQFKVCISLDGAVVLQADFEVLIKMLWASFRRTYPFFGTFFLLHTYSKISPFSVMVLSIKEHYSYLQFSSALSYIMFTLCYYAIDSQQVNCALRQTFIIFPMLLHKSSFPISPACVHDTICMHLLIINNSNHANNSLLVSHDKAETLPIIKERKKK